MAGHQGGANPGRERGAGLSGKASVFQIVKEGTPAPEREDGVIANAMRGATQPEPPPGANSPAGPDTTPSPHDSNTPPPHIPDHELLRRIGGGSYGEV